MGIELSTEQYNEMLRLQCPYCAQGLPDERETGREMYVHFIPGSDHRFDCQANKVRGKFSVRQVPMAAREGVVSEEQVKYMVNRFLGWRLPDDFRPDAGISFHPTFNDHLPNPPKHNPTGTNLFDATQTQAMVLYMVAGIPGSPI